MATNEKIKATKKRTKLEKLYDAVSSGKATEKELTAYTALLINRVRSVLKSWRDQQEGRLLQLGLNEWVGVPADTALAEALENLKQGKAPDLSFFYRMEQQVREYGYYAKYLGGLVSAPPPRDLSREGFAELEKQLNLWNRFLTCPINNLSNIQDGTTATDPFIRNLIGRRIGKWLQPLERYEIFYQRVSKEIRKWESGKKILEHEYDTNTLDYYSEIAADNSIGDICQMKPKEWETKQDYSTEERDTIDYLSCTHNKTNVSIPLIFDNTKMKPFDAYAKNLLIMSLEQLRMQNVFRKTTEKNAKCEVSITIEDFAKLCGISDKNLAQKRLRFATQQLMAASINVISKTYHHKLNEFGESSYQEEITEDGYSIVVRYTLKHGKGVDLRFDVEFVAYIANTYTMRIPFDVYASLRHPAQMLLFYILHQRDINANKHKDTSTLTRSIKKLIGACPNIPRLETLTSGQRQNARRTVTRPFFELMRSVRTTEEVNYTLVNKAGEIVSENIAENVMRFSDMLQLNVILTFPTANCIPLINGSI